MSDHPGETGESSDRGEVGGPTRPPNGRRGWPALIRLLGVVSLGLLLSPWPAESAEDTRSADERPSITIPRLAAAPVLEDFVSMRPSSAVAQSMARVDGFRQNEPRDGAPISQRTEAYLGYDDVNLYVVWVCFHSEPETIRARLSRREDIFDSDDTHDIFLDTFNDQRRAYLFVVNPLGIQGDAAYTERAGGQFDNSFDTVWHSRGTLTPQGYVVWVAIPFRSLRFSPEKNQEWGIILGRRIKKDNEVSFWPYVTSRIEGMLNQEARLLGISDVSPGRNLQLIPYGFFRSFRALDSSAEEGPRYVTHRADFDGGADFKTVFRDSLVLDLTANPDFSQIESDEPQVTVNQRFEVFFPERRPFFLENASYFETPINLFFSRRIVNPQVGARLSGKMGPYAVGALYANDRAPGQAVPIADPRFGGKGQNGVFRVSRDLGDQSNLGLIYTDSQFEGAYNRVGGLDTHIRINANWIGTVQGVASSTRLADGEELSGPAWDVVLQRTGRKLSYTAAYNDRSPGFRTALGFLPGSRDPGPPGGPRERALLLRPDFRGLRQTLNYRFRPEGDVLIAWGPDITVQPSWRHDGSPLDTLFSVDLAAELVGQTHAGAYYAGRVERLSPDDFPVLPEETRYDSALLGLYGDTQLSRIVSLSGEFTRGTVINVVPPDGVRPELADSTQGTLTFTWFTTRSVKLQGTYILSRLTEREDGRRVFDNHIGRAKLSWQPTPRLTLRTIVQYDALVADPALTSLEKTRNLNVDVLATYLVNPWTALYVGYNNNQNTRRLLPVEDSFDLVQSDRLGPDSWQFFVKFSYLFRF